MKSGTRIVLLRLISVVSSAAPLCSALPSRAHAEAQVAAVGTWTADNIVLGLGVALLLAAFGICVWRYRALADLNRKLTAAADERRRVEDALDQSEEKLRRSEAFFRALIENSTDVITVIGADGRILFQSRSAEAELGFASAEMVGRNALDFIHPDDAGQVVETLASVMQDKGATGSAEFRFRHRDGGWRIVSAIGKNALDDASLEGVVVVARDVTHHRATEESLRQAQKMEIVGRFTGGVAHDFNNLLAVIVGNLDLVDEKLDGQVEIRRRVHHALGAAQRGATLTQRLLAYSRKQPLQPCATDLVELVSGAVELLASSLGETIEVETVLGDGLWPATVDPHQLETALANLALNARDAMPHGGKLTIEAANARLDDAYVAADDELESGDYVVIAVSDTGDGIAPDDLPQVFEPFFTTKDVGRGSGLGLSMVYGFAKQSGGHVNIYSEPGQGTTVRIYLPRADIDVETVAPAPARVDRPAPRGHGETVLVVEDDAAVREACVGLLADLGYAALAACDGKSALAVLDRTPNLALLFTDVVLPGGMSGAELAPEARRRRPRLKVLYTSGYTENAVIHQGRLDDGVELLEKPYRKAQLARKLRQVLDS